MMIQVVGGAVQLLQEPRYLFQMSVGTSVSEWYLGFAYSALNDSTDWVLLN